MPPRLQLHTVARNEKKSNQWWIKAEMKDFQRFSFRWWHYDDTVEERVKREERDRRARREHIPVTTADTSCRRCGDAFFLLLLRRDPSFVEWGRKGGTRASVGEDWDKNLHLNEIKAHHKASYCLQRRPRSSPPKPTARHPLETLWASSLSSPEISSNLRPPQTPRWLLLNYYQSGHGASLFQWKFWAPCWRPLDATIRDTDTGTYHLNKIIELNQPTDHTYNKSLPSNIGSSGNDWN